MQEELGGTPSAAAGEEDGLALPGTPVQAADDWWAKRFQALFLPNITYPDNSMGFIQVRIGRQLAGCMRQDATATACHHGMMAGTANIDKWLMMPIAVPALVQGWDTPQQACACMHIDLPHVCVSAALPWPVLAWPADGREPGAQPARRACGSL